MMRNRSYNFVWLSAIALVLLLGIQVTWLLKTAKAKEELFNEKASMVLAHTAQELCADKATCANMGNCCLNSDGPGCVIRLERSEINKIDSLLRHFMSYYNLRLDYAFEVIKPGLPSERKENNNVFVKRLEEVANQNGLDLKLTLPGKKTFILQEMGLMFISSILLIVIVFFLFVRATRSLVRERKIADNTTEFLNNMTHEFKTPLTNISLAGKMIVKEGNAVQNEKIKHYSGIILAENEKLKQQAEQVLSLSALERGAVPLSLTTLDMHALIDEALKCISVQVENREGQLKLELNAARHLVYGDRTHLMNSICNLVDNAIKYSREKPEVRITTNNTDRSFILTVTDNGIGIAKEFQEQIFQKYFRIPTGDVHDVKGFGLGLAYVKKIVELHKGKIELVSDGDRGSQFTITLPLASE